MPKQPSHCVDGWQTCLETAVGTVNPHWQLPMRVIARFSGPNGEIVVLEELADRRAVPIAREAWARATCSPAERRASTTSA